MTAADAATATLGPSAAHVSVPAATSAQQPGAAPHQGGLGGNATATATAGGSARRPGRGDDAGRRGSQAEAVNVRMAMAMALGDDRQAALAAAAFGGDTGQGEQAASTELVAEGGGAAWASTKP